LLKDPNLDRQQHAPSLWADTAERAPDTQALGRGEYQADLVVVGGGLGGLSAALHAAERGLQVILLEASEIGWGASGRNNGQVIPCLTRADPDVLVKEFGPEKGEALVAILRDSASGVFGLIRKHRIECEAVQNGWVQPAHRRSRLALAQSRHDQWKRRGAAVELLDQEQVAAVTGSTYWCGGWQNTTGGHINPLGFARGLARAALDLGAQIHTQSAVIRLERDGNSWKLSTAHSMVRSPRVILATQGYTGFHARDLRPGLARSVVPARSYQMATQILPEEVRAGILPRNHALSDTQGDLHFARLDASGRLVTGGALIVPLGYESRLRQRIGLRLHKLFPQLAAVGALRFDYLWHGDFAATPDKLPRFHRLDQGLYSWMGCNGRGLALATALGPLMVEAALGAEVPLPFEQPRAIAAHALVRRVAMAAMLYYRWRDRRD
jgi:glycine/D-amino acid oxidase-like deaminating enzyme